MPAQSATRDHPIARAVSFTGHAGSAERHKAHCRCITADVGDALHVAGVDFPVPGLQAEVAVAAAVALAALPARGLVGVRVIRGRQLGPVVPLAVDADIVQAGCATRHRGVSPWRVLPQNQIAAASTRLRAPDLKMMKANRPTSTPMRILAVLLRPPPEVGAGAGA